MLHAAVIALDPILFGFKTRAGVPDFDGPCARSNTTWVEVLRASGRQ